MWLKYAVAFTLLIGLWIFAHLFVPLKLALWIGLPKGWRTGLIVLFYALAFSYPVLALLRHASKRMVPALLVTLSSTWMAVIVYLFLFALLFTLGAWLARLAGADARAVGRVCFWGTLLLTAALLAYGALEARGIRVRRVEVTAPGLPAGCAGLKVAHLSDLHLGTVVGARWLAKVRAVVEREAPDALLFSGDVVDESIDVDGGIVEEMRRLTRGRVALGVTGNHEFYAGLPGALRFMDRAGIRLLRGESEVVAGCVRVAGVDDEEEERFLKRKTDLRGFIGKTAGDLPLVLLKHRPTRLGEIDGRRVDLVLAGHTHGGQIFPIQVIERFIYAAHRGFTTVGGLRIVVTNGAGTWGPPIRVGAPPEVWVITLKPGEIASASN